MDERGVFEIVQIDNLNSEFAFRLNVRIIRLGLGLE
jgi:hypothetical protein